MDDTKPKGDENGGGGSISLQITELRMLNEMYSPGTTIFEPPNGLDRRGSNITPNSDQTGSAAVPSAFRAPEKKLTLFALRLAVLEKTATGLGTLGFIWATVVLLGGFAITLEKSDFWCITVILLIEGTRIFSRSRELEWQRQATWSITGDGINSFRAIKSSSHFLVEKVKSLFSPIAQVAKQSHHSRELRQGSDSRSPGNLNYDRKPTRKWNSSDVPILPWVKWMFLSQNVSKFLYLLQILSALACVVVSLMQLIRQDYGEVAKGDTDKRNRKDALLIFYSLALAEAVTFLMEKAYWEWKVTILKLLEEVNEECELGPSGLVSTTRFFYDAYSKCLEGSIFDGLEMDMVSFAMELVDSNSSDEQLIGIRILCQFAMNVRFSDDTLQKIGTNIIVIERLVEMLNWKDLTEEEIRKSAAEILSKLAGKKQNSLRVAGISGAMESVSSLLQNNRTESSAPDEIGQKKIIYDHDTYGYWTFNQLGLLILKKLARDHNNCEKIGNTRGLLPKIIEFTHAEERVLKDDHVTKSQILTVKRSLQVVKMLASTTCSEGRSLRKEIAEMVFTVSNIRDVLKHGGKHPILQKLGIEILTNLAQEVDATERIGRTGGVLEELFSIFFKQGVHQSHVCVAAGEALAMLSLESESNCHRILTIRVLDKLVEALNVPLLRGYAARILRHLCSYSGADSFNHLKGVTASAPTVIKTIMSTEEKKLLEVMVGLAAEVFKYMNSEESTVTFENAGIAKAAFADVVVQILKKYKDPAVKVPRIRRYTIELAIWMLRDNTSIACIFQELGLVKELENVLETTSELESFNIFSGTVGMYRYRASIHSLVETAMNLLAVAEK